MMHKWYRRITQAGSNEFAVLGQALTFFDEEYDNVSAYLDTSGRITSTSQKIGGWMAYTYGLLQELEAILEWANIRHTRALAAARKHFLESYPRQLTDSQSKAYAEADTDVVNWKELINDIALIRNRYIGLTKGLEALHFQLTNISRLHAAGLEDAEFTVDTHRRQ